MSHSPATPDPALDLDLVFEPPPPGKNPRGAARQTMSKRAGLSFPVVRIRRHLRDARPGGTVRIGETAPVYLASVLEYLSAELLEMAGNAARDNHHKRITPRHITLAIGSDEELNKLLKGVHVSQGGSVPFIHANLLPKRKETGAPDGNGEQKKKNKNKKQKKNEAKAPDAENTTDDATDKETAQ